MIERQTLGQRDWETDMLRIPRETLRDWETERH